jgi:hypothetical protein
MKKCLLFVLIAIFGLFFISCPGNPQEQDPTSYVEVYKNPTTKYWERGDIYVSHVARGKYNDLWLEISYHRPDDYEIRHIIYEFDQVYEKLTSFLNLYEDNSRIQIYNYLILAGVAFGNGEMGLNGNATTNYVHELTHILHMDNMPMYNNGSESWYLEFLALMGELYFNPTYYNNFLNWKLNKDTHPYVSWLGDWDYGMPHYYSLYGAFAYFLYDIYGEDIFYDLMHSSNANQQALSDVLTKRGTTLSTIIAEFENIR